jgi:hypothetical protein
MPPNSLDVTSYTDKDIPLYRQEIRTAKPNLRPRPGRPLSAGEKDALSPYIAAIDLESAVLHERKVPFYLLRRYQAIARGNHIYVRAGAFDATRALGLALLGHELVHVGQYRGGMTWLHYLWSVRAGYAKSSYERAAVAIQARIFADLSKVSLN